MLLVVHIQLEHELLVVHYVFSSLQSSVGIMQLIRQFFVLLVIALYVVNEFVENRHIEFFILQVTAEKSRHSF